LYIVITEPAQSSRFYEQEAVTSPPGMVR
jgi:hypothetical protein